MALSAFVGSFTVPSSTGAKAVTGVGFQPKAVFFFGQRMSADGATSNSPNGDMLRFAGMATSSLAQGSVDTNDDFSAVGLTASSQSTQCIRMRNALTVEQYKASFTSMDADGFTVGFSVANATAYVVNFLALGGTDLTNAKVISFSTATATGNQAVTGAGFQPDAVILIASETTLQVCGPTLSVFTGTSARGSTSCQYDGTSVQYLRNDKVFAQPAGNGTTVRREADLVSLDSDGFTVNWSTVQAAGVTVFALCLKGGSFKAGSITQKTSTGTQAYTGVGFQPTGLLFFSHLNTSAAAVQTNRQAQMIGAVSGASNRAACVYSSNGWGVAAMNRAKCYVSRNDDNPTVLESDADYSSFDSDGFTLNYGTADATARQLVYLAVGNGAAAATKAMPPFRRPVRFFTRGF